MAIIWVEVNQICSNLTQKRFYCFAREVAGQLRMNVMISFNLSQRRVSLLFSKEDITITELQ